MMNVAPICYGFIVAAWSMTSAANAFEIQHAEARFDQREYRIELRVLIDASPERVASVLRDYAQYPKLEASILEAKILERPTATQVLLYTKLRGCSGIFCRTVNRVERVDEASDSLIATAIPERSDVHSGHTETRWIAQDNKTLVTYHTSVTPKFWVPAFIGRPLMLRTLKQTSLDMFRNIEVQSK
jgi:hypothetical protein